LVFGGAVVFAGELLVEIPVAEVREDVDVDDTVGFGSATPVDCGILAAPDGISTILLVGEFRFDCAIPIRLLVRSKTA
jgi:hypothetical protein